MVEETAMAVTVETAEMTEADVTENDDLHLQFLTSIVTSQVRSQQFHWSTLSQVLTRCLSRSDFLISASGGVPMRK